jgi:hypothetical protein
MTKQLMSAERASVVDEICADIEDRLEGTSAKFVLVIWLDNRPTDPKAICVASPPDARKDMLAALATVPSVLEAGL